MNNSNNVIQLTEPSSTTNSHPPSEAAVQDGLDYYVTIEEQVIVKVLAERDKELGKIGIGLK